MSNITKEQAQEIWAFKTNHGKPKTVIVNPVEGFTVTLKYEYSFDLRYGLDVEVVDSTVKISKEMKKLEKLLSVDFQESVNCDMEFSDYLPKKEYDTLTKAFDKARNALDSDILVRLSTLDYYTSFNDFWSDIQVAESIQNAPKPTTFVINPGYTAKITKGAKDIQVGCQSIPIANVKALLEAIENENKD